jgi:DNA ligase 1
MSASWISKLNESDSRLHKESVIRQALTAAKLGSANAINFLTLAKSCYNPYTTFGVKQVPDTEGITNAENPWLDFIALLDYHLQHRVLTGNAARDAIVEMSQRFDSVEWNNFCAPVIRRDLRAGISDKTINKICKKTEYEIPVFGCQLATNSEGRPEMKGTKRLEPKLDGVRVLLMVFSNDTGTPTTICFSRNGKVFENFSHIEEQIAKSFTQLSYRSNKVDEGRFFNEGFVLDGEVIGNTFQELMRQARRKENVQANDSVFNIFDILPISDFKRGYYSATLGKRIDILESLRSVIDTLPNVELLPHLMVNLDTVEGKNQLMSYAKDQVNLGFEGIMIKDVTAPYECKRNTNWLKWKPTITVDLEVISVEEGTGRNKGRLGALVCNGMDDGKEITVNVGSGFSDQDRDDYWINSSSIIGRTAEILCDVITQNQDGTYSLRFPRFVRFRDDKC